MALGTPEQVAAFSLGGYTLEAMAPEAFRTGITVTYKFFFYKKGEPVVQKGRVTPNPITLDFRLKGPDAVDAELFIRAMAAKQEAVTLSWLDRFSFKGYITLVGDFSHTRLWVTGSITFQPTEDTSAAGSGMALGSKFQRSGESIGSWLDALKDAINGLNNAIADLKQWVDDLLQPLRDVATAIDLINAEVLGLSQQVGDIAAAPYQALSELAGTIDDAITLLPIARDDMYAKVLAPVIPLLQGTTNDLAQSAALGSMVVLDDAEDGLWNLRNAIAPEPLIYKSQYGDTPQDVADIFGVTLGALLALNSTMGAGPIAAGTLVKIPATSN